MKLEYIQISLKSQSNEPSEILINFTLPINHYSKHLLYFNTNLLEKWNIGFTSDKIEYQCFKTCLLISDFLMKLQKILILEGKFYFIRDSNEKLFLEKVKGIKYTDLSSSYYDNNSFLNAISMDVQKSEASTCRNSSIKANITSFNNLNSRIISLEN